MMLIRRFLLAVTAEIFKHVVQIFVIKIHRILKETDLYTLSMVVD